LCLACIWMAFTGCTRCLAADLVQEVPAGSVAYEHLQALSHQGLLAAPLPMDGAKPRVLTRLDVAFLLVEPLQRFIALVEVRESTTTAPEQRRRATLASKAVEGLTDAEFTALLGRAAALRDNFRDMLETLSPGLAQKAAHALNTLAEPRYRAWTQKPPASPPKDNTLSVNYSIETHEADSFRNPLPLLPPRTSTPGALLLRSGSAEDTRLIGTRSIESLEAAINVVFNRLNLYTKTATLPGADPTNLLRPDANRRAMLGVRVDFGHLNELGFTGIFEYHIMRTGDPAKPNYDQGGVAGFGLTW
jgi:hypothetical protein